MLSFESTTQFTSNCSNKKRVSYLYRTASTIYPCFIPDLGEFDRSWSYKTYPLQRYEIVDTLQLSANNFYALHIIQYICINKTP